MQKADSLIHTRLRLSFTRPELVPHRDLNLALISVTCGGQPTQHPDLGG